MPAAYDLSTVIGGSGSTVSHNNLIPLGTDTHASTDMHTHHIKSHTHTSIKECRGANIYAFTLFDPLLSDMGASQRKPLREQHSDQTQLKTGRKSK